MSKQCTEKDCDKKVFARGLCNSHYRIVRSQELGQCSITHCGNLVKGHGLCATHLSRVNRHGTVEPQPKPKKYCGADGCSVQVIKAKWCRAHWKEFRTYKQCSIEDCTDKVVARGWCSKHYYRWKRHKSFDIAQPPIGCKVDGCKEKHNALGYCHRHYQQTKYGVIPKMLVDCLHCGLPIEADSYNTKLHPQCVKPRVDDQRYRKRFGIGLAEYDALFKAQRGVCAICNKQSDKKLAVDHDHDTGEVRGLLCGACNRGIGLLKDDAQILHKAIEYLKSHPAQVLRINEAAA